MELTEIKTLLINGRKVKAEVLSLYNKKGILVTKVVRKVLVEESYEEVLNKVI